MKGILPAAGRRLGAQSSSKIRYTSAIPLTEPAFRSSDRPRARR
ncbi:Uncharacterised protein [Bordetella pertussis]|nr:Uncharacterised protein [Bordetella pertussis]